MKRFRGVYTALITPFTDHNKVDEEGLRYLIQRQIECGVDGITVLGSTGEDATLTKEERQRVITIAKEECNRKLPLMVGTGSNSTEQAIQNTLLTEKLGADVALVVVPYYNRPTQEGLFLHFQAIAQATKLPLIVYNVPVRSGQNLLPDTFKRLLEIPSIVGIKEASGNISQISDVIEITRKMRPDCSVLSGDDGLTLPLMALGGDGIISVISNLFPQEVKELVEALSLGNFSLARDLHYALMPFVKNAFIETNPIPIKAMLQLSNLPSGNCRLPLCSLSEENAAKIEKVLNACALMTVVK